MTRVQATHQAAGGPDERELSLEVEGGSIVGWMSGEGPPLVLLHGGPGLSEYL